MQFLLRLFSCLLAIAQSRADPSADGGSFTPKSNGWRWLDRGSERRHLQNKLDQDTEKITTQLVSLRSGSAFLEQLRRVTPEGVKSSGSGCSTCTTQHQWIAHPNGRAGGFEQINAFALNLSRWLQSPSMEPPFSRPKESMAFHQFQTPGPGLILRSNQLRSNCVISAPTDWRARFEFLQKGGCLCDESDSRVSSISNREP